MENEIMIREAVAEADIAAFWEQLHSYFKWDIFTDTEDEDRAYFLGEEYRGNMQAIHDRPKDKCYYLFLCKSKYAIDKTDISVVK